jgi:hypothetical protein
MQTPSSRGGGGEFFFVFFERKKVERTTGKKKESKKPALALSSFFLLSCSLLTSQERRREQPVDARPVAVARRQHVREDPTRGSGDDVEQAGDGGDPSADGLGAVAVFLFFFVNQKGRKEVTGELFFFFF